LRQPLFSGFREFAAMKGLKLQSSAASFDLRRQTVQLFDAVATAFYTVVLREVQLQDLQLFLSLSDDRVKELRDRSRLGKSRASETLSAESQLAAIAAQIAAVKGDIVQARDQLGYLIGQDVRNVPVKDEMPVPSDAGSLDALAKAAMDRSDIKSLREQAEARRYGIIVSRSYYWPSLGLTGNYYTQRPGFQKDINWDLLFLLDVPIYQGGSVSAQVREAQAQLSQSEADLHRLTRLVDTQTRQAHAALNSSLFEAEQLATAYDKVRRSYESFVKEYRYGLVTNLDVLQAMNAMQTAKQSFDQALIQSKLDQLRLRATVEDLPM
jgi:outer membrane protein